MKAFLTALRSWFDTSGLQDEPFDGTKRSVHWPRVVPFILLHAGCLAALWVGWSPVAVLVALALYLARIFFITGFYHRYFSHKTFKTSRAAQFAFAVLGNSCVQRGPLWWPAHHRLHHSTSDQEGDPHSPHRHGIYWSHIGWLTSRSSFATRTDLVPDLARYPELRWLDRFDTVIPMLLAASLFGIGFGLERWMPSLGTNGPQMLVWGFFVSTTVLLHASCLVNSAAHFFGRRRYGTSDHSRNSFWIALVTFGEGWHNNHHHYPAAARNGFFWWEIDVIYYLLRLLAAVGIIWDLNPVPQHVLSSSPGSAAAPRASAARAVRREPAPARRAGSARR